MKKSEKLQIFFMLTGLILAVTLLVLIIQPAFTVAKQIQTQQAKTESEETIQATEESWPEITSEQNITNILLVGHNYREDEPNMLADSIIICSVNRDLNILTLVSVMRDLLVPLPAYAGHTAGRNRINVCYALGSSWTGSSEGGMEMLELCIEQNFGIPIDHTVEISFESFVEIIDYVGGVEIDLTEAEAKYMSNEVGYVDEVNSGVQVLDGWEALAYARIRGIDNDRTRTARQRNVIQAVIESYRNLGLWELLDVGKKLLPMIKTNMEETEAIDYLLEFIPKLKTLHIEELVCPVDNDTLPGSMWSGMIELYGMPCSVVQCDFQLNSQYLQEKLGIYK